MNRAIIALLFFIIFPPASAQEIRSYNISVWLKEDSAYEEISVLIFNQHYFPLKTFSYALKGDVLDIEVHDFEGRLDINTTRNGGTVIQSRFREPLQPNASTVVMIRFNVTNAVSKVGEGYVFSPVFSLPAGTEEFRLKVRLPEGMGLPRPVSGISGFTDVAPLPDSVYSDGRAIIFEWKRYRTAGDFAVYIRYTKPYTRGKKLYAVGFLLVLAVGGYYLLKSKRRRSEVGYMEDDMKRVLDIIKANDGIVQKEIVDITGFSKAKVSMIVSNLERDGLIRKEKFGLKNRLYLAEKYKKS
jgi:uncharacterized membrane protein